MHSFFFFLSSIYAWSIPAKVKLYIFYSSYLTQNDEIMTDKVAFTMKLKANVIDEYKRRHDEIWPELVALLRKHGISDYSIFLDEQSLILFAVQKKVSSNTTSSNEQLRQNEIMQRWWVHMADLMETNDDRSPVTHPLKLVFHMD